MNESVTIVIGGVAVAKGRPRVTRRGFVYTPAATRKYEAHGRLAAQQATNGRPPIAGPVRAEILIEPAGADVVVCEAPGRCVARRDQGPTSRPDCDKLLQERRRTRSTGL